MSLKEINPEYPLEELMLNWSSNALATWCKVRTLWKRPWCWERLKAGGEGDDRGWDGWMVSPTQWTGVWASSGSWWWTGKTGMLHTLWGHKESTRLIYWTTRSESNFLVLFSRSVTMCTQFNSKMNQIKIKMKNKGQRLSA